MKTRDNENHCTKLMLSSATAPGLHSKLQPGLITCQLAGINHVLSNSTLDIPVQDLLL